MRKSLLASIAVLGLAAPAFAQTSSATSPPSPNASNQVPQSSNSLPAGGATSTAPSLGSVTTTQGGAPMATSPGMTGMQPMRAPHRAAMRHMPARGHAAAMSSDNGARPGNEPGTGNSMPMSDRASNIDRADTRSDIAPRLPVPEASGNTAEAYLSAANRAISRRQTGAAQEALERAETRLLDRSVAPDQANTPMSDPRLTQISDARRALASRDYSSAQRSIQMAMQSGGTGGQMGQQMNGQMPMNGQQMGQPGMTAPATGLPR